jgi:hypothetical protein
MTDAELYTAAESVHDGWYADTRIDWEDFLDRLESYADVDLGCDLLSPRIKGIKRHIAAYRKL